MESIWLKVFLGKTGQVIIWFVDKYYLFLLPLVFIYGIFITLSSLNLKRIRKNVFLEIIIQAIDAIKSDFNISNLQILDKINIDWEKFINRYSFFPFITSSNNLWVCKINIINVREAILPDKNKIFEILEENGLLPTKE